MPCTAAPAAKWLNFLPKLALAGTFALASISLTHSAQAQDDAAESAATADTQEEITRPAPQARPMTQSQVDAQIARLYGKGVSAYFDGLLDDAIASFNEAAEMGTTDPRVYYFRGFAFFNKGEEDKARENFQTGATMEVSGTPQYYPINRSIERIQGAPRALLEEVRTDTRNHFEERVKAYRAARYERLRRAEEWVLRKPFDRVEQIPAPPLDSVPNLPFPMAAKKVD